MELKTVFFVFLTFKLFINGKCNDDEGSIYHSKFGIKKLFVFGDSYADTGNVIKMFRNQPYGISYPGKPAGRFSDGLVLTDYVAKFLGLKSPIPYRWRRFEKRKLYNGMNFAFGGAGVFQTIYPRPNISAQIDYFERLINQYGLYKTYDVQDSLVLVTLSGNDYSSYLAKGEDIGLIFQDFVPKVVNELESCLRRISELGAKRIVVGSVPPLGCLPYITMSNDFKECSAFANMILQHNVLLNASVAKLNDEIIGTEFGILDLQNAFFTILNNNGDPKENLKFPTPLKPCCVAAGANYECGDVETNGTKMYTLCDNPQSSFFWDDVHPTQAGWRSIFPFLKSTLQEIATFS